MRTLALPKKFAQAALFTLLLLGCREQSANLASARLGISGGHAVEAGAWPMVVWLDNGCSGVLLEPDLVVYAAHCGDAVENVWTGDAVDVVVDEVSQTVVISGSTNGGAHEVSFCQSNLDYRVAAGNDVAFCVLARKANEVSTFIGALPAATHVTIGTTATLVGFGHDEGGERLGIKRSAEAEVVSVGAEVRIGDAARGTCAGDSGSPAFVRVDDDWALLGVLASGLAGDECGPGYYTRMDTVLPWLESETGRELDSLGVAPRSRDEAADSGCTQAPRSASRGVATVGALFVALFPLALRRCVAAAGTRAARRRR